MTKKYLVGAVIAACGLTGLYTTAHAQTESLQRKKWWPSEYGADDQLGAANRLTPQKVLEATSLIRKGNVVDLGRVVEFDMPQFELTPYGRKHVHVVIAGDGGGTSYGPVGENQLAWNEDYIAGHLTQNGTQFDSFAHMATRYTEDAPGEFRYYNGLKHSEIAHGQGFKKLGAEKPPPFFTSGVFIDVQSYFGRAMNGTEEISVSDLIGALKKQGMTEADIKPGDVVLYNTGWGDHWKVDNHKFNTASPGLSPAAGDWLAQKKIVLVGTDNWSVETIPGPNEKQFAANHQKFLIEQGIYIIENMDFKKLREAKVYKFAFSFGAIPFKGATGSPARPFVIY
uniref:CbaA n=1 Tax=Pigmentiphaga sp. DL-8 TaxID=1481731 RepID=A0A0S1RTU7_9BURK|nr:CbaA [Pigmentiphaga sp. DL-8]